MKNNSTDMSSIKYIDEHRFVVSYTLSDYTMSVRLMKLWKYMKTYTHSHTLQQA